MENTHTRAAYCFDENGWLTHMEMVDPDPLTPGQWLLPPNSTLDVPPFVTHSPYHPRWIGTEWVEEWSEVKFKRNAARMRMERNLLLKQTDWTQLPDSPLTQIKKMQFWQYRKRLRTLPEQEGWPFVAMPEPPGKGGADE